MTTIITTLVNWKKLVRTVITFALAMNGAYMLLSYQIPQAFNNFVKDYATKKGYVSEQVKEVPVVVKEDIKNQVSEGIKENLPQAPSSAGK
jgi:uncharacterized membrane-anchored protein